MARRGKTVIGERDLAQSQVMLRAGEEGIKAEQRATQSISQERGAQQSRGIEAGKASAAAFASDRAARQTEEGQGLDRDIATGREIQADKTRKANLAIQGLEETPGGPESPLMARYRESLEGDVERGKAAEESLGDGGQPQEKPPKEDPGAAQAVTGREPGQEPEATQQGMAGPPAPGVQPPPRMDAAAQQAETPLETSRPGDIRPTAAAREATRHSRRVAGQAAQLSQAKVAVDMRNADANFLDAETKYMDAQTKGAEQRLKAQEAAKVEMQKGMAFTRQKITDLTNREIEPKRVALAFMDNPDIQQAMEAGEDSPELQSAVARVLNNKLATQNIRWAAVTGEALPDYGTGDLYQRFNMRQMEMTAAFRSNGVLTATAGQDPTLSDPFRQAARMQGAGLTKPQAPGEMGPPEAQEGEQRTLYKGIGAGVEHERRAQGLSQSWAGIRTFEEKEKFIRRATARAMMAADAMTREARSQYQNLGMADALAQSNLRADTAEQKVRDLQAAGVYGPGVPGAQVTELEGGQRVPTDRAARTERDIATRAEGGTPRPADAPARARNWDWAKDLPK